MELELEFGINSSSTLVSSLIELLMEKRSPNAHRCAQPPPLDVRPLNESIKQLENKFSSMAREVELVTKNDTSKNLVLYGLPETEQNGLELSFAVLGDC